MTPANGADNVVATDMIDTATNLLSELSDEQRERASWPFPSDEERRLWFYTPTDHGGLSLGEMGPAQQQSVQRLLATALSHAGFNTAAVIQGQENVLDRLEGFKVRFGRERDRDPQLYWIAIFGEPGTDKPWGWRFGGHHLSMSFTLIGGVVVSATPLFLGADPARAPLLGPHVHRPLAGLEDLGRELARSLHPDQASQAILAPVPPLDLISANRSEVGEGDDALPIGLIWRNRLEGELDKLMADADRETTANLGLEPSHVERLRFSVTPKGIAAGSLQPDQQEILRSLLMAYVEMLNDDFADREALKFAGDRLDQIHFVWAGGLEYEQPHYYRIHGGDLFAEYDNAQRNGNHVHTVWRDLSNDFGGDSLADHYASGHSHHS